MALHYPWVLLGISFVPREALLGNEGGCGRYNGPIPPHEVARVDQLASMPDRAGRKVEAGRLGFKHLDPPLYYISSGVL